MSPWSGFRDPSHGPDLTSPDGFSAVKSPVWPEACIDIPEHIPDPSFCGLEVNTKQRCFHGDVPERMVAFDMAATGHKFLGCPCKDLSLPLCFTFM